MDSSEPIVFKVFYEVESSDVSIENSSVTELKAKEIRKVVFAYTPNFKQLYDRLVKIENEKRYNTECENISSFHKFN